MRLSELTSLLFPRFRVSDEWRKYEEQGFSGELSVEYVKDIMMASKGDTILVAPGRWFILVNLPFRIIEEAFRSLGDDAVAVAKWEWRLKVIRDNMERKYVLAKLIEARIEVPFTKVEEVYVAGKEGVRKVVDGVEFTVTEGEVQRFQRAGTVEIVVTPSDWKTEKRVAENRILGKENRQWISWKILDKSTRLAGVLQRFGGENVLMSDAVFVGQDCIVSVSSVGGNIKVKVHDIELPSEGELLECSRFYTVIVPRLISDESYRNVAVKGSERFLAEFDVYFKGRKRRLIFNHKPPETLFFRCLRQKKGISTYARRILPRGIPYIPIHTGYADEWPAKVGEFTRTVREEILPKIRNIRSKPKTIESPLEALMEILYINTPKRKVKVMVPYIELFEKVKDLAPKATLYLVFYGQVAYRRRLPNFVGFKIDKDGNASVLSKRVVPVSGIVLKGGEFERNFREVYNIDKLVSYQYVGTQDKLQILRGDVEEVRAELEAKGVNPAEASFKEVFDSIKHLAMEKSHPENIVYVFFKYMENAKREEWDEAWRKEVEKCATVLAGLVKTGRSEEFAKLQELGVLRTLRVANLWTMKSRGYSPRKGVLFLGDVDEVKHRILEVVKKVRGRILALLDELEERREIALASMPTLKRLEALMKEI